MAALDFPNSPTNGQQYSAPNGAIYTYDGTAWTTSGVLSTGSAAGGDLQGTYPNPSVIPAIASKWTTGAAAVSPTDTSKAVYVQAGSVVVGSPATKARTQSSTTNGVGAGVFFNRDWFNGNAQDDAAKLSWTLLLRGDLDQFRVERAPAGSTTQTAVLLVDGSGNLTISGATATKASGTAWVNPSDERMKRNVEEYATGLDAVTQLRPVRFEYNGQYGSVDDGRACYGFVAQEVEPIMPECVGEREWRDPDDAEVAPVTIKTLDQSNIILALVNAVRTLAARVEALEAAAA